LGRCEILRKQDDPTQRLQSLIVRKQSKNNETGSFCFTGGVPWNKDSLNPVLPGTPLLSSVNGRAERCTQQMPGCPHHPWNTSAVQQTFSRRLSQEDFLEKTFLRLS
jgi:hypothetical protein